MQNYTNNTVGYKLQKKKKERLFRFHSVVKPNYFFNMLGSAKKKVDVIFLAAKSALAKLHYYSRKTQDTKTKTVREEKQSCVGFLLF